MEIVRPVFVVGVGRSGSTFFANLFTGHPELAFPTRISHRFPERTGLQRAAMTALELPLVGDLLRRRLTLEEAYPFWESHAAGFTEPFRDLRAGDVTEQARSELREAVRGTLTRRRHRFFAKITGWSRIGYLREVFPDALFVHVVRDGRDVANSLLSVDYWLGWRGPENWRHGPLPPELEAVWERHDRSFAALAGIAWILLTRSVAEASRGLPEDAFLELRYEDFVEEPLRRVHQVLDFAGLASDPAFDDDVRSSPVYDRSGKYRRQLTERQQRILNDVLADDLARYGYEVEAP